MSIRIDYAPMNNAPTTAGSAIGRMNEYIYQSRGEPLANECGEIHLARAGEIVRCRDCRYFRIGTNTDSCGFTDKYAHHNGFCAWGERKERIES